MTTPHAAKYVFVVPCGATKHDEPVPARELYRGSLFQYVLGNVVAEAEATRTELGAEVEVLILSAQYGLVGLDQVLAPYNTKMGDAASVSVEELAAQAVVRGIGYGTEVFGFLPKAYLARLEAALAELDVNVQNSFEAVAGCGDQRKVTRTMRF